MTTFQRVKGESETYRGVEIVSWQPDPEFRERHVQWNDGKRHAIIGHRAIQAAKMDIDYCLDGGQLMAMATPTP